MTVFKRHQDGAPHPHFPQAGSSVPGGIRPQPLRCRRGSRSSSAPGSTQNSRTFPWFCASTFPAPGYSTNSVRFADTTQAPNQRTRTLSPGR